MALCQVKLCMCSTKYALSLYQCMSLYSCQLENLAQIFSHFIQRGESMFAGSVICIPEPITSYCLSIMCQNKIRKFLCNHVQSVLVSKGQIIRRYSFEALLSVICRSLYIRHVIHVKNILPRVK